MTCQEAWKLILGALESTYDDNIKDALLLLAQAAVMKDEIDADSQRALDQMME